VWGWGGGGGGGADTNCSIWQNRVSNVCVVCRLFSDIEERGSLGHGNVFLEKSVGVLECLVGGGAFIMRRGESYCK